MLTAQAEQVVTTTETPDTQAPTTLSILAGEVPVGAQAGQAIGALAGQVIGRLVGRPSVLKLAKDSKNRI